MPAAARITDTVLSKTGSGNECAFPMTGQIESSNGGNGVNVYIVGQLAEINGNQVFPHPQGGCSPDTSTLNSTSQTVFIGGKGAARIGDTYTPDNIITSGASTVFIGD